MREAVSFVVSVLAIIAVCLSPVRAQTTSEREIDTIRQDVSRLYSATDKKVGVRMRSGTRLKGYIRNVGSETFTLRTRPNSDTEIRYADVSSVTRTGLSSGQKWAIFGGIMGAAVVASVVFRSKAKGGLRCLLCN